MLDRARERRARARTGRSCGRTPGFVAVLPRVHAGRRAGAARDRLAPGAAARRRGLPRRRCARSRGCSRGRRTAALLPAWYGCGTALGRSPDADGLASCAASTGRSPFFRSLVENLEMTLAKSSLEIARGYLELVPAELEPRAAFRRRSRPSTRERSRRCSRSSARRSCSTASPSLQRSIRLRNPYVDPMNAIQVELLRRYRDRRPRTSASRPPPAPPLDRRHRRRRSATRASPAPAGRRADAVLASPRGLRP